MNREKNVPSIVRFSLVWMACKAASLIKTNFVVGSLWTSFSLSNCFGPLAGVCGGLAGSGLLFLSNLLYAIICKKAISLSFLAFSGIPTLCASLYWASQSKLRALIPIICMMLFIVHPIGMQAAPYALFWLIPFAISFQEKPSLFATALGSTFISHAVGSVIWLYTTQMDVSYWYGLLTVVPGERLLYAAGMTVGYQLMHNTFSYYTAWKSLSVDSNA